MLKLDLVFGCLLLLARMKTGFFIFHLVILAGKNLTKTKANVLVTCGNECLYDFTLITLSVYNE